MNVKVVSIVLFACSCLLRTGIGITQDRSDRCALIGTWRLVSTEEKMRDGHTRPYPDLGEKAKGYLVYGADGWMCVALMRPDRAKWHSDQELGSKEEKMDAATGFTSYCGKYAIDEVNHVVTHYPEVSFFPNYIGTVQKRPYTLHGIRLTFSDTPSEGDVERWTIVWDKESDAAQAACTIPK